MPGKGREYRAQFGAEMESTFSGGSKGDVNKDELAIDTTGEFEKVENVGLIELKERELRHDVLKSAMQNGAYKGEGNNGVVYIFNPSKFTDEQGKYMDDNYPGFTDAIRAQKLLKLGLRGDAEHEFNMQLAAYNAVQDAMKKNPDKKYAKVPKPFFKEDYDASDKQSTKIEGILRQCKFDRSKGHKSVEIVMMDAIQGNDLATDAYGDILRRLLEDTIEERGFKPMGEKRIPKIQLSDYTSTASIHDIFEVAVNIMYKDEVQDDIQMEDSDSTVEDESKTLTRKEFLLNQMREEKLNQDDMLDILGIDEDTRENVIGSGSIKDILDSMGMSGDLRQMVINGYIDKILAPMTIDQMQRDILRGLELPLPARTVKDDDNGAEKIFNMNRKKILEYVKNHVDSDSTKYALPSDFREKIKNTLDAFRAVGLFHRDLHERNIMIDYSAEDPEVYIIDFGSAIISATEKGVYEEENRRYMHDEDILVKWGNF